MELDRYLAALRRSWALVLALAIGSAAASFVWSSSQPDVYRSSSAVFFQVSGAENTSALLQGSNFTQNQVRSYAELATKEVVLQPVVQALGLESTPQSLAKSIDVSVPLDTAIVEISASAGTPEEAQALANEVAAQLGAAVEGISAPGAPGSARPTVTVDAQTVQQANLPTNPVSPMPRRDAILGLVLGLAAGIAVALVREYFNNRVTDEDSLSRVTDLPLLGRIPWTGGLRPKPQAFPAKSPAQREALSRAAANYEFVNHSGNVKSVVITSAQPGEGKTTTAANLAATLSESQRVLLIDADLRNPSVAPRLGLEGAAGLTTVITGKATLADVVQPLSRSMHVLTAGPMPPNPLALIGSQNFANLIAEARTRYDAVIIDAPPILPVTDSALLARIADGAILVIGSRRSNRKQVARALKHLSLAAVPMHGVIVTQLKPSTVDSGYYGAAHKQYSAKKQPGQIRSLIGSSSNGAR
jgi:capsular exopolysaccharide synthesis family protein